MNAKDCLSCNVVDCRRCPAKEKPKREPVKQRVEVAPPTYWARPQDDYPLDGRYPMACPTVLQ